MKKGDIVQGVVRQVKFPNLGIVDCEGESVQVKNVVPGQRVELRITKKRSGRPAGMLLQVLEPGSEEIPSDCPHFDPVAGCGGCNYRTLPEEAQLRLKKDQVSDILREVYINPNSEEDSEGSFEQIFEGIKSSPKHDEFRNKMEFSFGDSYKDGPLALGMHKRGGFYDILTVDGCRLVDGDFRLILTRVLDYTSKLGLTFFHRMRQEGYLRHLLVRKAERTGEILVALVTTSTYEGSAAGDGTLAAATEAEMLQGLVAELCKLEAGQTTDDADKGNSASLAGSIAGILHIVNDSVADVVKCDKSTLLYGRDHIYEKLLGMQFKISPFSFFQTNTGGAEVLYETVRDYCRSAGAGDHKDGESADSRKPVIFDLYSGTGTIAQMMAPVAEKVVGVEIVEEAVEAAKENAELNGLHNCEFIAGDVLKVIDEIRDKPDLIILDPPRDGIHPKALPKILSYGVKNIIYISCKPTSLARDLVIMQEAGYYPKRICAVDLFPGTVHCETVCLLGNRTKKPDDHIEITVDVDALYDLAAKNTAI